MQRTLHGHKLILENLQDIKSVIKGGVFLEVGSSRDAGSTTELAHVARNLKMKFITVDPDSTVFTKSLKIVKAIDKSFSAFKELGEEFIAKYEGKFAIVYLDAFDNIREDWPHKESTIESYKKRNVELTNENSWKMHLDAAKGLIGKMIDDGYICFDDTEFKDGKWEGKGKLAVPFLLDNGYEIICKDGGNCLILQNTGNAN